MIHILATIGFFIAVGAVVGLIARLVTFDRFRLSLPMTIALGTLGATVGPIVQWWVMTPEARSTTNGSWLVSVLGAVAVMAIYRAWHPVTTGRTQQVG